jgi:predicted MFS family arabinose efflux permease
MAFMASMMWGALSAFFPLFALSHGIANPGPFFAVIAIILIFTRSLGGRIFEIKPREKVIFPCLSLLIMAVIILTFSKTFPMFIFVAVIWGLGHAFIFPSLLNYAIDQASSPSGSVIGTYTALSDFGSGIGPVIMGIVLQFASYPAMFLCSALAGFIGLFYFYSMVRKKGSDQYANL